MQVKTKKTASSLCMKSWGGVVKNHDLLVSGETVDAWLSHWMQVNSQGVVLMIMLAELEKLPELNK